MDKFLKEELVNIIEEGGQQSVKPNSAAELRNSWSEVAQPPTWQSSDDCSGCRCLIHWPDYPLGGGTKIFCGYRVLVQGKAKKVELSKLVECPKDGIKIT